MIRFRLADILDERGWTAYRLVQESGLPKGVVYRLVKAEGGATRVDLGTLDTLCRTLRIQPGDLLEYAPQRRRGHS